MRGGRARHRRRHLQLEALERRVVLDATIVATSTPVSLTTIDVALAWTGDTTADDVTLTYNAVSPQFTFSDPGHTIYVPSNPNITTYNNDSSSVSIAPNSGLILKVNITSVSFTDGTTSGTSPGTLVTGNTYNLGSSLNTSGTSISVIGPTSPNTGTVNDAVVVGDDNGRARHQIPHGQH